VHPVGGMSSCYSGLITGLEDRPIYGLQARGLNDGETPPADLGALLADYADQMRRIQPSGPYYLLGWSLGGNLAHLLAVHLQELGEEVELLVLFDAYPADEQGRVPRSEQDIIAGLQQGYASFFGRPTDPEPRDEREVREQLVELFGRSDELRDFDTGLRSRILDVTVNNVRLAVPVVPGVYHGSMLLLVATRNRQPGAAGPEAWVPYLDGEIESAEIDSEHARLMDAEPITQAGKLIADKLLKIEGAGS
jgi:nonribosomal peptide synthetase DhbF